MASGSNTYRTIFKIAAIVVAVLLVLATVLRLSLKTDLVRNKVWSVIISQSTDLINGELTIGAVDGDLWKELTLLDIGIIMDSDTLFRADTLSVTYHLPALLGSQIEVQNLRLSEVQISASESDGAFDLQQLLKEAESPAEQETAGRDILLRSIQLRNGDIAVHSPAYLPDTTLRVQNVHFRGSAEVGGNLQFAVDSLAFRLLEGRLPEPLDISMAGGLADEQVTLEQLVIRTGRSMLEASAEVGLADSTVNAKATLSPLALADLVPYLEQDLNDLRISIESDLKGDPSTYRMTVQADHPALRRFDLDAAFSFTGSLELRELNIRAEAMDLSQISDSLPELRSGRLRFSMDGLFRPEWHTSEGRWSGEIRDLRAMDRGIGSLKLDGTIRNEEVMAHLTAEDGPGERIRVGIQIADAGGNTPNWLMVLNAEEIDMNNWLDEPAFPTRINGWVSARGSGFSLSDEMWTYRILASTEPDEQWRRLQEVFPDVLGDDPGDLVLDGQLLDAVTLQGSLSRSLLEANGEILLGRSTTNVTFGVEQPLSERPDFQYSLSTQEFNVADLKDLPSFPTNLNLSLEGNGRGLTLEGLELYTEITADSSIINGAALSGMNAILDLKDGIFSITRGVLESEIVEGTFTGRKNLINPSDPDNRLSLDLGVKNIQPLAPLLQVETLNAVGSWKGDIVQDPEGDLTGTFDLDLQEVRVDSMFTSEGIQGAIDLAFDTGIDFKATAELRSPVISGVLLQDVQLTANGRGSTDSLSTEFSLNVKGSTEGRFTQQGNLSLHMPTGDLEVYLTGMEILTDESALILRNGFTLSRKQGVIRTDTLYLADATDATYLKLAVPYADSVRQQGWMEGKAFDFGLTQEVLLGKKFVDGVLSGDLTVNREKDEINGVIGIRLDQLRYNDVSFDSLTFRNTLRDRRLSGQAAAWWDGERHLFADLSVPFAVFTEDLNDAFFESPVNGTIEVSQVELARFEPMMRQFGYPKLLGILNMNAAISGSAGDPDFEGALSWTKPVVSGINLDEINAGFDYDSDQEEVLLNGEVMAGGQQAASLSAEVPFSYDFRSLKLNTLDDKDSVAIELKTRAFNLAVFNGFLDPEFTRNLKGQIDAELQLNGSSGDLTPSGFMNLTNASLGVPIAGITLEDIRSSMKFTESGLQVDSFTMSSGPGSFTANGTVSLNGLTPDSLNLNARARQFRLANTNKYNLLTDLTGTLNGTVLTPALNGTFKVLSGFVYLDDFGEDRLETVYLEDEEENAFSLYDSLSMDMQVVIERNFFVRNQQYLDLEIELTGELDATKRSKQDLSLFGSLEGRDGYVMPLNKLFTMEESSMTFTGPVEDPEIFVRSKHIPPTRQKGETVTLFYIIEGSAQEPEFRFDSEPYMEEQDIVCYTLFGKPCYSLESWQSVFADGGGTSAKDVLTDVLLDEVESLATRNLGVDLVQIDNTGTAGGTSITTGWYLNEKTFFAIINEITSSTPRTMFMLEYVISDTWDLILMQGDSNQRGIDFRYEYDY